MLQSPARPSPSSAAVAVPDHVLGVISNLRAAGHEAYVVGGGLRDAFLPGPHPLQDWDVATTARPPQVQALFPRTLDVGIDHGTVTVLLESGDGGALRGHARAGGGSGRGTGDEPSARAPLRVEVTTFRADVETFGRKARVRFSDSLEEDLARRDFTINAMAYDPITGEVIDPFGGRADMATGLLRTVGDPLRRFEEDYLRILRGARFAARFRLTVPGDVRDAMRRAGPGTAGLARERVRDELVKTLVQAAQPSGAFTLLRDTGVLAEILPELDACFGVAQNRWHADDVGTHILMVVDAIAPRHAFLRVVALLHDVGKPAAKAWDPAKEDFVFRGHDEIGARLARGALERLRFSRRDVERAVHLIAVHMDLFPVEAGDAAVRRWLQRVGEENVRDLFRLHFADWGGNRAKARPATELRALYRRAREVAAAARALKVTDLAIGGDDLRDLGLPPGPRYREILEALLQRVLDDPALNEHDRLLTEARRLAGLPT